MEAVLSTLSGLLGVVALVCWILVLVKMFQQGAIAPAVASLVLILCGIGPLVALVYGWMMADQWRIRNIMVLWTACLIGSLLLACGGGLIPRQIGI
jgi:hypothetical protein